MRPRIAVTVSPSDAGRSDARQKYRDAVEAAGGDPVLIAVDQAEAAAALSAFDGLLLPGGIDIDPERYQGRNHATVERAHPRQDAFELDAARYAKRSGLPLLAICRGMQVVNVALGGSLYEDIDDRYAPQNGVRLRHKQTPDHARNETTHVVDLRIGSRIAAIAQAYAIATNTLHHQAVKRLGHGLVATAHARDGIVEALEYAGEHPFFIAVQWHPEELHSTDSASRNLFARFVDAAAQRGRGRGASRAAG